MAIEITDELTRAVLRALDETSGTEQEQGRAAVAAVLAIVERDYVVVQRLKRPIWMAPEPTVHLATTDRTDCCGRRLVDLPTGERTTLNPHTATCRGPS